MNLVNISDIPELAQVKHSNYFYEMSKLKLTDDIINFGDFWNNIDNFGYKEYRFYSTKLIRNRAISILESKLKIRCVGGEYMSKEKSKMVFVDSAKIPARGKKSGVNYETLLSQIPDGKAWIITEDDKDFKLSTVKSGVKQYNKEKGKDVYDAVQRTENGKVSLYVSRIPEIPEETKAK